MVLSDDSDCGKNQANHKNSNNNPCCIDLLLGNQPIDNQRRRQLVQTGQHSFDHLVEAHAFRNLDYRGEFDILRCKAAHHHHGEDTRNGQRLVNGFGRGQLFNEIQSAFITKEEGAEADNPAIEVIAEESDNRAQGVTGGSQRLGLGNCGSANNALVDRIAKTGKRAHQAVLNSLD